MTTAPSAERPLRVLRASLTIALIVTVATIFAACGSSGSVAGASSWEAATERGTYGVGVTSYDLVDSSRPTAANRDFSGADERPLPIDVWYPSGAAGAEPEVRDAPLDGADAPYPLIIFAHGLSGTRRQSVSYVQHLASHGYVVAAPDFPLSRLGAPGGPRLGAVLEQPKDVSFVIDSLLEFNAQDGHLLEGAIDDEAIGVTGHSLGALTTMLTTFGPSRDERIDAALPISTPACFLPASLAGDTSVPIMVVGG
ncbi:MAG: hypothetical protein Q8S13_09720, partial [Dehalococcoidia bacterium]|nr:hypothetical protein [Dehalococcoidia bacterium]